MIAWLLVGCGPKLASADPVAVGALHGLVGAAAAGEPVGAWIAPAFEWVDAAGTVGPEDVDARLAAIRDQGPLAFASAVDGHHEVVRAWWSRGSTLAWLFAAVDTEGRLSWVAEFEPPLEGDDASDAVAAYQEAWNTGDDTERDALLTEAWAVDGRYVDPTGEAVGRGELGDLIGGFRSGLPGAKVLVESDVASSGAFVHFRWEARGLAGTVRAPGMDVARVDPDGRLSFVGGFFGALDPD
ncbi:MAG: nuclear transport factor 2 family protein [Myxococcota bacterium]